MLAASQGDCYVCHYLLKCWRMHIRGQCWFILSKSLCEHRTSRNPGRKRNRSQCKLFSFGKMYIISTLTSLLGIGLTGRLLKLSLEGNSFAVGIFSYFATRISAERCKLLFCYVLWENKIVHRSPVFSFLVILSVIHLKY